MELVRPALAHLESYAAALKRGWSPDNVSPEAAIRRELDFIERDPAAFCASMDDREALGGPITLPDGRQVARLPGYRRWMWDGEMCGSIGFRWQPGTADLPDYVLGHVGYAVVPWKRSRGYASAALAAICEEAAAMGLPWLTLTTDPDNVPSQRVIENCGGERVERFQKPASYGGGESLRWRINLRGGSL